MVAFSPGSGWICALGKPPLNLRFGVLFSPIWGCCACGRGGHRRHCNVHSTTPSRAVVRIRATAAHHCARPARAHCMQRAAGPRLAPGRTPGRCAPPLPCAHARIRLYIKETSPSCTARCAQCDRHTRSSVDTASSSQLGNAKCVCAVPRSRRRLHSLPRAAATKLI